MIIILLQNTIVTSHNESPRKCYRVIVLQNFCYIIKCGDQESQGHLTEVRANVSTYCILRYNNAILLTAVNLELWL